MFDRPHHVPSFRSVVCLAFAASWLCGAMGCQPSATAVKSSATDKQPQADHAAAKPEAAPLPADDPAAVKQLEEAGFTLTKNKSGTVIGAAIDRREDASELLPLLAKLPSLETLKLGGTGIGDAGFDSIETLSRLKRLDLYGAGISDVALLSIGKIPNLEVLSLRLTGVSDAGMKSLEGLKSADAEQHAQRSGQPRARHAPAAIAAIARRVYTRIISRR